MEIDQSQCKKADFSLGTITDMFLKLPCIEDQSGDPDLSCLLVTCSRAAGHHQHPDGVSYLHRQTGCWSPEDDRELLFSLQDCSRAEIENRG